LGKKVYVAVDESGGLFLPGSLAAAPDDKSGVLLEFIREMM
jgi:hypothetical protein